MAAKIQRVFLEVACAPLTACATRLRASQVRDALATVTRAKLENALHDGLTAVAARSGARLAALEAAVPTDQVSASMARLEEAHRAANQVFVQFLANNVSLAPPAMQPRPANAELRALAARYALDRHICGPLESLADELAAWQSQLEALGERLAGSRSVMVAQVRRWLVRGAVALAAMIVAGSAAGYFAWSQLVVRAARSRIATALASPDPCAWENVADKDLAHATPAQKKDYDARKPRCAKARAERAHEAACATLADHIDAGAWDGSDAETAGASAALLQRTIAHALDRDDLLVDGNAMPCQDSRVAQRLWDALCKTAGSSAKLWASAERVSPSVASMLRRPGFGLTPEADAAQLEFSDSVAKRAITRGHPDELERAMVICQVRPSLGLAAGRGCAALERVMKK